MVGTPESEINITKELVRDLIYTQIHELSTLPLIYLENGWDNVMYKLGDHYIVRLPRRQLGANLILNEQKYLDYLPTSLPIDIPRPIFIGEPQSDYPWKWSVLPYYQGKPADQSEIAPQEANRLIDFLKSIHQPANGNAPINDHRGVSLALRAEDVEQRLQSIKLELKEDYKPLQHIWNDALKAPQATQNNWIHGDLHPRNILINQGKLSAIIDWGDITSGDVATDLASVWMLFDDHSTRLKALESYVVDDALIARTKGWVIYFAAVFYQTGLVDNPRHIAIGKRAIDNLLQDFK